jgi:long-chain acyl-CoA synthetase
MIWAAISGEFLVFDDGYRSWSYSYRDTTERARAFAARLHADGITRGQHVVIWSENRPEWIVALWGCLLRGVVLVPIDYRASADFLQRVARIVDAAPCSSATRCPIRPASDAPVWKLARPARCRGAAGLPAVEHAGRRRGSDLHVGRDVGAQGRRPDAPQHPREHRADRARDREVPQVRAAVPADPLPEPAAAQPHVRAGDGDVRAAAARGRGRLQPHVRARRDRRADSHATDLVLVSVPKILEVLRDYMLTAAPESAIAPEGKDALMQRWWRYRRSQPHVRPEVLAMIVGAAPARSRRRGVLGTPRISRVQGYGLTETAPIVTLNHPFHAARGAGRQADWRRGVKIADDGEILVRART